MEKPLYPLKNMRITQGYGIGTHTDSFAIDDAGKNANIEGVFAPFTGVIKKIYIEDANEVWLESIDKVEYPDGTIDYMTIMFAHCNDVSHLKVGQIINKGKQFYSEGTKGNATGNHCHFECGVGKFIGSGWHVNSKGYWIINNSKNPQECLWIDDTITIINSNNYKFKKIIEEQNKIEENVVQPPEEEEITIIPEEKTTPTLEEKIADETPKGDITPLKNSNDIKLIFKCKKDDIYAIKLKKDQELFLR